VSDHPSSAEDASQARDVGRGAAQQVSERVHDAKVSVESWLGAEVDTRSTTAGEQVVAVSQAMRDMGDQLRSRGSNLPARLADEVADRAERLGGYMRESDAERILGDVEDFGRRQPWIMAAAGVALGAAAARVLKASSQRRHRRLGAGGHADLEPGTGPRAARTVR
jgi:hypothetical protein